MLYYKYDLQKMSVIKLNIKKTHMNLVFLIHFIFLHKYLNENSEHIIN